MSGSIIVCPLSKLPLTLNESQAGSVVSLLARGFAASLPALGTVRHLEIDISDISLPQEGHVLPAEMHIERLLEFVAAWDRGAPLLIHCYAGVSRSTAAAYAAFCALNPDIPEEDVALRLRAASPTATPNPRVVALADKALRRGRQDGRGDRADRPRGGLFRGECFSARSAGVTALPGLRRQMPPYQS